MGNFGGEVAAPSAAATQKTKPKKAPGPTGAAPRNVSNYKLKCPGCSQTLAFEEGCVKCYSCGFSQC